MLSARKGGRVPVIVREFDGESSHRRPDELATEEPLEIRVIAGGERRTAAVTMRTPGADFELAAGFAHGEGIVETRDQIRSLNYCQAGEVDADQLYNIVNLELAAGELPDLAGLDRHFAVTSACGVCGKASLDALEVRAEPIAAGTLRVSVDVLRSLPDRLRRAQGIFDRTGGLHAAGLFTVAGELVAVREDVGRHNALDKLLGWALLDGRLPLSDHVVLVSGRASFELLQKCLAARVSVVAAVSAPSSLAVDLADRFGITLVGFLRGDRCNVYTGEERILVGS